MIYIGNKMERPPTEEELSDARQTLPKNQEEISSIKSVEFIKIQRSKYVAEIGIINGDLVFHFYGYLPPSIDLIFEKVFKNPVLDQTNFVKTELEKIANLARAGKPVSSMFILDIYKQAANNPTKIQKSYSDLVRSWTYTVKDADTPFVDVMAKKIIDGIDEVI